MNCLERAKQRRKEDSPSSLLLFLHCVAPPPSPSSPSLDPFVPLLPPCISLMMTVAVGSRPEAAERREAAKAAAAAGSVGLGNLSSVQPPPLSYKCRYLREGGRVSLRRQVRRSLLLFRLGRRCGAHDGRTDDSFLCCPFRPMGVESS